MERSVPAGCRIQSGGAASRRGKMGQNSRRIIISEEQVASTLDMRGAIEAVERGLAAQAHGEAVNMLKTHTVWNGSTLHAIGAVFPKRSEEHTSELQSLTNLVCRLLLEKNKKTDYSKQRRPHT